MSKKKIVFDSVALGLNVLMLIFFALPFVPGASMFLFVGNMGILMSLVGAGFEGVLMVVLVFLMFLLMLFTLLNICFLAVALLCDLNVIKNKDGLAKGFKKTALILSSIDIAFMALIIIIGIVLYEAQITYFSAIINLLLTIAIVVLTNLAKSKKNDVADEEAKPEVVEKPKSDEKKEDKE